MSEHHGESATASVGAQETHRQSPGLSAAQGDCAPELTQGRRVWDGSQSLSLAVCSCQNSRPVAAPRLDCLSPLGAYRAWQVR